MIKNSKPLSKQITQMKSQMLHLRNFGKDKQILLNLVP